MTGEAKTWGRLDNRGGECQGPRESVTLGGQQKSDGGARQVVGDGMQGRWRRVNQGDLSDKRPVNSWSDRSQSAHNS